ncbi:MAG: sensor histidine kinase [Mycobacteriales bacterium]
MNSAGIAGRWSAGLAALRGRGDPPPRLSRWAWAADAILAVVLTVGTLDGAMSQSPDTDPRFTGPVLGPDPPVAPPAPDVFPPYHGATPAWQYVLAVLAALPLVVRRRYPLAAFWVVILASQLYHLRIGYDPTYTFIACVVAAYSATIYSPYRLLALGSAFLGTGLIIGFHHQAVPEVRTRLVAFLLLIPIGFAANAMHTWKQRVRALEAEQEAATRQAVEQERARIAQELHDVVTHNVSVMVVQAGAARKVMTAEPEKARAALLAVESGGRAAMSELRHVMGLLTMNGEGPDPAATADLAPVPGLNQLGALAGRVRDTGVPVELTVTGDPAPLPPGVDLAAYRVVQEALTNAVKHAAGASVTVTVAYGRDSLRVDVADTGGTPTPAARAGNGRGLVGLRERLAVYGGTLEAGPRPTGGYRVRAVIPLEDA